MEIKNKQFDSLLSEIQNKEKTREKSYTKFMKTENGKKKDNFIKWSSRRQAAKHDYERSLKDKEEASYYR